MWFTRIHSTQCRCRMHVARDSTAADRHAALESYTRPETSNIPIPKAGYRAVRFVCVCSVVRSRRCSVCYCFVPYSFIRTNILAIVVTGIILYDVVSLQPMNVIEKMRMLFGNGFRFVGEVACSVHLYVYYDDLFLATDAQLMLLLCRHCQCAMNGNSDGNAMRCDWGHSTSKRCADIVIVCPWCTEHRFGIAFIVGLGNSRLFVGWPSIDTLTARTEGDAWCIADGNLTVVNDLYAHSSHSEVRVWNKYSVWEKKCFEGK